MLGLAIVLLVQAFVGAVSVCLEPPLSSCKANHAGAYQRHSHCTTAEKAPLCVWVYGQCVDRPARSGQPCYLPEYYKGNKEMCEALNQGHTSLQCVWVYGNCLRAAQSCGTSANLSQTCCEREDRVAVANAHCDVVHSTVKCLWLEVDGASDITQATPPLPPAPPPPTTTTGPPTTTKGSDESDASIAANVHVEAATVVTWMISIFGRSSCI